MLAVELPKLKFGEHVFHKAPPLPVPPPPPPPLPILPLPPHLPPRPLPPLSPPPLRGKSWADQGDSLGPDRHARDVESLDKYALERWEVVLHFMVGCPSAAVSQDLSQLLIQAGLMRT